jgi:para-aminobenzoate synthetase component 1
MGAPKISAMKIIDQPKRVNVVLQGAVGYFTPDIFDFNVVIQVYCTIKKKTMCRFSVGSAITSLSSPKRNMKNVC